MAPPAHQDAHSRSVEEVLAALGSDPKHGLSQAEARSRLGRHGRNELAAEQPVSSWRRFLAQFQDALVVLLLAATSISAGLWAFERASPLPYEAMAILAVVLLNATMGYLQESRAEAAVAALRRMSAAKARVVRGGTRASVPAAELVPGDVIVVEEGDTIPADARLICSAALQTAESALTGESLPVAKDTRKVAAETVLGDRHNMVFSGTAATYGRGRAGEVMTMFFGVVFAHQLGLSAQGGVVVLPLLATQLLWINLATDAFAPRLAGLRGHGQLRAVGDRAGQGAPASLAARSAEAPLSTGPPPTHSARLWHRARRRHTVA